MPGSAVADIRETFGATFIGSLVSAGWVFSLSFPHPLAEFVNSYVAFMVQQSLRCEWSDASPSSRVVDLTVVQVDLLLVTEHLFFHVAA